MDHPLFIPQATSGICIEELMLIFKQRILKKKLWDIQARIYTISKSYYVQNYVINATSHPLHG